MHSINYRTCNLFRRVYISYLDSVHYFQPRSHRTQVYHEIIIGYLEHVKSLGYVVTAVKSDSPFKCLLCSYQTAHIWACPPSEGDDYIYHCHPPEQKIPKPRRLQEWLRRMIEQAKHDGVVNEWKVLLLGDRAPKDQHRRLNVCAYDMYICLYV